MTVVETPAASAPKQSPIDRLKPLRERTALVTGGSAGIGLGVAGLFGELGANVMIVSRREAKLIDGVQAIRARGVDEAAVAYRVGKADSEEDAQASVAEAIERWGSLDILVNNAATNPYFGPLVGISRSQAEKTVAVNQSGDRCPGFRLRGTSG